jgi:phosphoglycolate phosphatase-like HAD superfamily hydrolase
MNKYTIIVFDFDVIHDVTDSIVSSLQATINELGLPRRSDDECRNMIALKKRVIEIPAILFPDTIIDQEQFARTYLRILDKVILKEITVYPRVMDTLQELNRRGMKICMISERKTHSTLDDISKSTGLTSVINCVLGKDDVSESRPSPEAINIILKKFNAKAEEVILVGDTIFDVMMAKSAEVAFCGVTYRSGKKEDLTDANWIIDEFCTLVDII